jgi:threonine/homoserine/homoserine lactone efflux protein
VPLDLLPFLVASVLVTVVPGADMALVPRQVLVGGTGLAQRTIFGNLSGLVVPRCRPRRRAVGAAGVGGRLHRGHKLAGAGYLLYCSDWSSGGLSAPLPPETHQDP